MKRWKNVFWLVLFLVFLFRSETYAKDEMPLDNGTMRTGIIKSWDQNDWTMVIDEKNYEVTEDCVLNDAIRALVSDDCKTVVFQLTDGKISKITGLMDVISPTFSIKTKPDSFTYQNGRYSKDSIEATIEINGKIKSTSPFHKSEVEGLYANIERTQIEMKDKGLNFGKKGLTKITEDSLSIYIGGKESRTYQIGIDAGYVPKAINTKIKIDGEIKFSGANSVIPCNSVYINIGNLDIQKQNADQKKSDTALQKQVQAAKNELTKNTAVALDSNLNYYFTKSQQAEIQKFLSVWLSEMIEGQKFESKSLTQKVQEEAQRKILKKLHVKLDSFLFFNSLNGLVKIKGNTKDHGERTFEFKVNIDGYSMEEDTKSYAALGQIEYEITDERGISGIPTGGTGIITFANLETFAGQVKSIAESAITSAYSNIWGKNADKVAGMFVDTPMGKLLAGKFSGGMYNLMTNPTNTYLKKVSVHCPVDVYVYDLEGKLCGSIVNNEVDSKYQELLLTVTGDEKNIYLAGDDYTLKLVGNDEGTMEYIIEEYEETGVSARTVSTKSIPLSSGKTYYSIIPETKLNDNGLYALTTDMGETIAINSDTLPQTKEDPEVELFTSGTCGENARWELYTNGILKIKGTGEINNYDGSFGNTSPWKWYKSNIKYILIEEGITRIGNRAFSECSQLEIIELPDSVTSIGRYGMYKCPKLSCIAIGSGLTYLGSWSLSYCTALQNIYVSPENADFTSVNNVLFSKDMKTLYKYSGFSDTTYRIPEGVETIEDDAFGDCERLGKVILPQGLSVIYGNAFDGCTNLSEINIPASVSSIGADAFAECPKLMTVGPAPGNYNIKVGWKDKIPRGAFSGCSSMKSCDLPGGITSIGEEAFNKCTSLERISLPEKTAAIGEYAFFGCNNLEKVIFSESLKSLGYSAFGECPKLVTAGPAGGKYNVELKWKKEIPERAFEDWRYLQNLTIPDSITSIGAEAFSACYALTSIYIPENVAIIGRGAFYGCEKLEIVTVPQKVTRMGNEVFAGCKVLRKVIFKGNAPEVYYYEPEIFKNCSGDLALHVPKNAFGFNKKPWTDYKIVYDGAPITSDYKITYNANGGKNAPSAQKKANDKAIILSKTKPSRTGYTFQGWSASKTASKASYQPGSSYKDNKDLTLYAVWKANAYKVSFHKNGGTGSMNTVSCTYGKVLTLPANTFKHTGCKFKGWNTKAKGTGTAYTDKASVKNLTSTSGKTVTLYAQWVKGQKLTYNANGGQVSTTSKTVYQGSAYGTLATPTRTGYTFAGWYTAKSGGAKVTSATKVAKSSSHTLYAHWTKKKYTVKYVLNGGKNNAGNPSVYYVSSAAITLKNPGRTGYTFAGWYTTSSYKTKVTQIAKGSTGNKTFYAKWSANTYTIRYNKNGGTGGSMADTKSCKYDTAYKLRANTFKRAGYQFAGWASSSSGAVVYKDKASVKNLTSTNRAVKTLYAKWTPYTYTINYHLNGGKNSTSNPVSYKVSSSTITLKNASRTGYTFKGWYTDSGCKKKITQIPKGNTGTKNLYAKWSANVYTIRYDKNGADGGSMADSTGCRYGTEYSLRTNTFIRKNYKFTGWNTKKDGSGKSYDDNTKVKNLTTENNKIILVYAQWEALTAKISFDNTSIELRAGDTFQLRPVITPAEIDSEIEYTSGDEAVASVNNQGMISAIAAGETEIYCKATDGSGVETEVKVVVTEPTVEVTSVEVITDTFTVKAGDTFQAGVTVIPEDVTDPAVSWSVSDPSVITVDENGYITAVGEGEADIIAVADNGVMGTIRITVENNTVQISNAEELTGIRNDLNGKYELTSDIDLSGYEWIPIGTSAAPFSGILNGNGHTISGLTITDSTQEYSGLFGYLTGEVQDLIVDGRMNLSESNGSRFRYAGSITAYAQKAKILNCISYVSVNTENTNTAQGTYLYAGGIAGSADSYTQIENCENYGGIYGTARNGTRTSAYAGGIAGETSNGTVISQCTNNGEIAAGASTEFTDYFATAYAGGITGSAGAAKVLDSVNHQTVTAKTFPLMETAYESSAAAGGIVGYAIQSTVEGGSATENISAEGNEYSKAYFGTEIGRYVE